MGDSVVGRLFCAMSGLSGVPAVSCGVSTWADAPALELVLTRAHFPILSGRYKKKK